MAGIRVYFPTGDDWQYSLDNHTWQAAPVFLTQTDGAPFEAGSLYTVFCSNPDQEKITLARIVMGKDSNSVQDTLTLQQVIFNDPLATSTPVFDGGMLATLPDEPANANFPLVVIGPDGTMYVRKTTIVVPPDPIDPPVSSGYAPTFSAFEHFVFVADTASLAPNYRIRMDSNTCPSNGEPGSISGWCVDLNHPDLLPGIRFLKNGQFEADIFATIDRPDVLTDLKGRGLVSQTQTFCKWGYSFIKPESSNNGQPILWEPFAGTSSVKASTDTGALYTTTCGAATPTNEYRRSGPESTSEGSSSQLGLERKYTNGAWLPVDNSTVVWSKVDSTPGIALAQSGLFSVAADSVSQNISVEIHAALPDRVIIFNQQVINTDCQRPGSLTTYILAWNFAPAGGNAREFSTFRDASDAANAWFDNQSSGTLSRFYAQAANLNAGTRVYLETDLSCTLVSDRIYYAFANGLLNTENRSIRVQNGLIVEGENSHYQACPNYHVLTGNERDALPLVTTYEYADANTPANGLAYTVRAFASREEAIYHLSRNEAQGTKAHFEINNATSAGLQVNDTLYNDNRPEHINAGTNPNYPVEAGYWGFQRQTFSDGTIQKFVLVRTNACGQIVTRELIDLSLA